MKHEEIVKALNQAYFVHKEVMSNKEPELQLILFRFMAAEQYEVILFDVFAWYKESIERARKGSESDWEVIISSGKSICERYKENKFCQTLVSYFLKMLDEL